eukprot:SM000299S10850  [mRNA]  locus=s299:67017:67529:- [translate_table: standard]
MRCMASWWRLASRWQRRTPPSCRSSKGPTVLHARRVDLVATPQAGGPRLILDVVTTDAYDRSHPAQCAIKAGYAVACAARAKELKYADHPREDEFFSLAIDMHGALGTRWLELLNQLARHAIVRCFHGEPVDFPAAAEAAAKKGLHIEIGAGKPAQKRRNKVREGGQGNR